MSNAFYDAAHVAAPDNRERRLIPVQDQPSSTGRANGAHGVSAGGAAGLESVETPPKKGGGGEEVRGGAAIGCRRLEGDGEMQERTWMRGRGCV